MLELCCQSLQVQSSLQLWRLREACRTHDRVDVLLHFLQRFQIGQPNPRRGNIDFGMVLRKVYLLLRARSSLQLWRPRQAHSTLDVVNVSLKIYALASLQELLLACELMDMC